VSQHLAHFHPIPRMRAEDRRELILDAAMSVFGDYGYVGTTTDQVARAAGVSQPYVVRIFGTKEKLFLEVLHRALATLMTAFRAALADPGDSPAHVRLGRAYVELLNDRGLLLSLMHGFVLGSDPNIGKEARCGFLEVYSFLRDEAGFSAVDAHQFLSAGMLINTMVGLRMSDEYDSNPVARELLESAFPEKLDLMLSLGKIQKPEGA
jgi:TetR/AcrR family transcriptional regulator